MGCQCANIPANVRVIQVGDVEVGVIDLDKIVSGVYFLKPGDEAAVKEELFRRARERNWIPDDRKEAWKTALFREYLAYAGNRPSSLQEEKRTAGVLGGLRRWLRNLRRSRKEREKSSWKPTKF